MLSRCSLYSIIFTLFPIIQAHDHVVKDLNEEFKKVDRAFETNEVRVFGKNTGHIFKELDVIRRKQLDIASDHVSLDTIQDIPTITPAQLKKPNQDNQLLGNFERKEAVLKLRMKKLDDLTQSMDTFKKIFELDYNGMDTLIQFDDEGSEDDEDDYDEQTSKRNILQSQKQNKKRQIDDGFLTAPATNTTTNTSSFL